MVAALLSDGCATYRIPTEVLKETKLSQVFIAIQASATNKERMLEEILAFMKSSSDDQAAVRYPGERTLKTRMTNLAEGIPVDEIMWESILKLDD